MVENIPVYLRFPGAASLIPRYRLDLIRLAKERLTIYLLCAAYSEKFQPLVIGKAAKPHAFNNKMPNDIIWRSNTKAWMIANKFKEYIQIWNKKMIRQNRKV